METKISVIIPAYNESKTIGNVLTGLEKVLEGSSVPYEIVVVNDGSRDDTGKKARDRGVTVIEHKENLGYGRSVKDGIRAAKGEFVLLIDADDTYEISNIPHMLDLTKTADLVTGKRIFARKSTNFFKDLMRNYFKYHTSYYSGTNVEDLNSGMKIFKRREIIDRLNLFPDGFSFTSTITVLYLMEKRKIAYTPVLCRHRERTSHFKSFYQFFPMMKLAFKLTFMARPFKVSLQMTTVSVVPLILSVVIGSHSNMRPFFNPLFFTVLYFLSFLVFMCYVYVKGMKVT